MPVPSYHLDGRHRDLEVFFEYLKQQQVLRTTTQRIAYASTITPDPTKGEIIIVDDLTGNITVNNPVGAREGMWLHFQFTQDGSGGHTISFGTDFLTNWTPSTTADDTNTISFRYDGTVWVQHSTATGL